MNEKSFPDNEDADPVELTEAEIAEKVREMLVEAGALWIYNGDPRRESPHALLTSGKHSNGYVNVGDFIKSNEEKRLELARLLISSLKKKQQDKFTHVVGADTSSTKLAEDVARLTGAKHIKMVKTEDDQGKSQAWDISNQPIAENHQILQVEDLITTSFSASLVREGLKKANSETKLKFVPVVPVIVERSDPDNRITKIDTSEVLPLLQLDIKTYDPDDCPYCKVGSEAIKPKEGSNWSKLTG